MLLLGCYRCTGNQYAGARRAQALLRHALSLLQNVFSTSDERRRVCVDGLHAATNGTMLGERAFSHVHGSAARTHCLKIFTRGRPSDSLEQ